MNRILALCAVVLFSLGPSSRVLAAECDRDTDCKGLKACVANKCVQRTVCTRDADCSGDQVCERNACVGPGGSGSPAWGQGGASSRPPPADAGMSLAYTKQTWPTSIIDRPLVVAPGMTEATLSFSGDVSVNQPPNAPHPLSAGLYARFGVSDRIHAGLDALSLCLTDCGPGGAFRYLSLGAGYALVATPEVNLVPSLTLGFFNTVNGNGDTSIFVGLQPGFLFGWRLGRSLQLFSSAGVVLGVIGRDSVASPDQFLLHVEPRIEIVPRFSIAPFVGYGVSLAHTDFYQVPVGVTLLFIADRAVDLGLSFQFNDVVTKSITVGPLSVSTGGADSRLAQIFGTFRF